MAYAGNETGTMDDGQDTLFGGLSSQPTLTLRCKVLLVGDSCVGKTCLAQVFQGGVAAFPKTYAMTIGCDLIVKRVPIPDRDGQPTGTIVEMYIVDCGGFPVCQDLLKPHWESTSAVVLVYDVANTESFEHLKDWYNAVKQTRGEHSAVTGVVVAAKMDLSNRPGCVTTQEGQHFSTEFGLQYFEVCATKGQVEEPFHFLAEVFHHKYCERKAELEMSA